VPLDVSTGFLEGSQCSFCPYSPKCVELEFCEVDIPALCVAPSLCGGNSYIEITGSWPRLHKTLSGAGRWNRANFALTEF